MAKKKSAAALPIEPLRDLLAWWRASGVRGMIIGGLAVGLRGRPRTTHDVDAVVLLPESDWPAFVERAPRFHFAERIPDLLEFARATRVFLVQHEPSGIDVDVSMGSLPFERAAVRRATTKAVGRLRVPVATVEDLIIFKAIANRLQDLADIDMLLELHADVDRKRILKTVDEFAKLLEAPEIYLDTDRLFRRHSAKKKLKR